jgi:hypothetical protein
MGINAMTMARYSGTVVDHAGNIVTNAKIEVRREVPGQPLAAIKPNRDGSGTLGNPFNANADGTFYFHAAGGAYQVRAYVGPSGAPTYENIRRYEPNGTAAEHDYETILSDASAADVARSEFDYLINGDGQVDQEGKSSLTDGVYGHDQWYALTETAVIAKSSLSDLADGLPNMMRLTQSQASAQRFGYAQVMEAKRVKRLRGKVVSFGGMLRYSNNAAVRYAILEWTGTADAVTKDVVNSWTNGNFTAGQFFNSTTLAVRAVGTITPAAATLTDFLLIATIGSSANNVFVFIWAEGSAAQNSTLDIAASLKFGASVAPLIFRPFADELALCQRYFSKGFGTGVTPVDGAGARNAGFAWSTTGIFSPLIQYPVRMRATPTILAFAPAAVVGDTPTAGQWQFYNPSLSEYKNASATVASDISDFNFLMSLTVSGATATAAYIINGNWTANARL